jgi:hypothetical protein
VRMRPGFSGKGAPVDAISELRGGVRVGDGVAKSRQE